MRLLIANVPAMLLHGPVASGGGILASGPDADAWAQAGKLGTTVKIPSFAEVIASCRYWERSPQRQAPPCIKKNTGAKFLVLRQIQVEPVFVGVGAVRLSAYPGPS